jgi:dTDP-4-dehydrorhamnose 3,5-epimerase
MRTTPTSLPDVLVVEAPVFTDDRGFFTEVFHADKFASLGLPLVFLQDNHSRSAQHTLRGLHYQLHEPQGKLVRAVTGRIFDVAVDVRRASPTFGQWAGVVLEGGDGKQLWIPPGFAHGFLVLSESADVSYKCTTVYHGPSDRGIAWNDPTIAIDWPIPAGVAPRLSPKDAAAVTLSAATVYE